MVRTRGLSRALGRVVDRGLGRRDRDDSNSAPQRRRPTASARKQQVPITIADDVSVVPVVSVDSPAVPVNSPAVPIDEPMVDANAQDTGAKAAVDEAKGFPGGSMDPSMLTEYAEHVAANI